MFLLTKDYFLEHEVIKFAKSLQKDLRQAVEQIVKNIKIEIGTISVLDKKISPDLIRELLYNNSEQATDLDNCVLLSDFVESTGITNTSFFTPSQIVYYREGVYSPRSTILVRLPPEVAHIVRCGGQLNYLGYRRGDNPFEMSKEEKSWFDDIAIIHNEETDRKYYFGVY